MIYSCPPSSPKPALQSQAGVLDSKHRIYIEKVCVIAKILHHKQEKENNYTREVLQEQMEQGWEGLSTELAEICQLAGLQMSVSSIYIEGMWWRP